MGKQQKAGFSLRTADASEGGGVDGALATIEECQFVEGFTYGGRHKDSPKIALSTSFRIDGFDKPWSDNWVVGDEANYELVNDGDGVRCLGKARGLNKKSAAYFFFTHLEEAINESGIDYDELLPEIDGEGVQDVSNLKGRRVRLAMAPFTNMSGDAKDKAVIAAFVEDAPVAKTNGKVASKPNGKAAPAEDDIEVKAVSMVEGVLGNKPVKKHDVINLLLKAHRSDPDIKKILNLVQGPWVSSDERPWEFDSKKGTLSGVAF